MQFPPPNFGLTISTINKSTSNIHTNWKLLQNIGAHIHDYSLLVFKVFAMSLT